MGDLRGLRWDAGEGAGANHAGHLGQRLHLQERLDLAERVSVCRLANTQAIVGQRVVAVRNGNVNIGVVEVVIWEIPVSTSSAD